jgi:hypothetical protein
LPKLAQRNNDFKLFKKCFEIFILHN